MQTSSWAIHATVTAESKLDYTLHNIICDSSAHKDSSPSQYLSGLQPGSTEAEGSLSASHGFCRWPVKL